MTATVELALIGLAMVRTAPIKLAAIRFAATISVAISAIIERSKVALKPVAQLAISFD